MSGPIDCFGYMTCSKCNRGFNLREDGSCRGLTMHKCSSLTSNAPASSFPPYHDVPALVEESDDSGSDSDSDDENNTFDGVEYNIYNDLESDSESDSESILPPSNSGDDKHDMVVDDESGIAGNGYVNEDEMVVDNGDDEHSINDGCGNDDAPLGDQLKEMLSQMAGEANLPNVHQLVFANLVMELGVSLGEATKILRALKLMDAIDEDYLEHLTHTYRPINDKLGERIKSGKRHKNAAADSKEVRIYQHGTSRYYCTPTSCLHKQKLSFSHSQILQLLQ